MPPFACRICGAGPTHTTPGTWGNLLPLEYLTGWQVCAGESFVFFCPRCFEDMRQTLFEVFAWVRRYSW